MSSTIERTLILLKPDAVQRGVTGEIITRFERVGLKIIGIKMVAPSKEHYHEHYESISKMITRRGQAAFDATLEAMMAGPVIAVVLEGIDAVALVRKMVGTTEPKEASPGTIRGDYAHVSFAHAGAGSGKVFNLIHASGDTDEAKQEVAHWFKDSELFEYRSSAEHFIRGE